MTDQNDKLPEPASRPSAAEGQEEAQTPTAPGTAPGPPDNVEVVEDEYVLPEALRPKPQQAPPDALRRIQTLKSKLDRKDKQIEQVMDAYRKTKKEIDKLQERVKKAERKRFERSKGDFIARFVEVLDNLDRAIDSIENNFDSDSVLQASFSFDRDWSSSSAKRDWRRSSWAGNRSTLSSAKRRKWRRSMISLRTTWS